MRQKSSLEQRDDQFTKDGCRAFGSGRCLARGVEFGDRRRVARALAIGRRAHCRLQRLGVTTGGAATTGEGVCEFGDIGAVFAAAGGVRTRCSGGFARTTP